MKYVLVLPYYSLSQSFSMNLFYDLSFVSFVMLAAIACSVSIHAISIVLLVYQCCFRIEPILRLVIMPTVHTHAQMQ